MRRDTGLRSGPGKVSPVCYKGRRSNKHSGEKHSVLVWILAHASVLPPSRKAMSVSPGTFVAKQNACVG